MPYVFVLQEKCYEEIADLVSGETPSLDELKQLKYSITEDLAVFVFSFQM